MSGADAAKLFNAYVRAVPADGSRSARPEETLLIGLARLAPIVDAANN